MVLYHHCFFGFAVSQLMLRVCSFGFGFCSVNYCGFPMHSVESFQRTFLRYQFTCCCADICCPLLLVKAMVGHNSQKRAGGDEAASPSTRQCLGLRVVNGCQSFDALHAGYCGFLQPQMLIVLQTYLQLQWIVRNLRSRSGKQCFQKSGHCLETRGPLSFGTEDKGWTAPYTKTNAKHASDNRGTYLCSLTFQTFDSWYVFRWGQLS